MILKSYKNKITEPVNEPVSAQKGHETDHLDKILYQRGKGTLGQKAAGQITKLKKLVGTGRALELIDLAVKKENPHEYIAAIIRNETIGGHSQTVKTIESAAKRADEIIAERQATGISY